MPRPVFSSGRCLISTQPTIMPPPSGSPRSSPTFTEVELTWLVHEDAVEGVDYDLDHLKWMWDVTTIQDTKIINDNQKGVSSSRYTPGPYSERESGSARLHRVVSFPSGAALDAIDSPCVSISRKSGESTPAIIWPAAVPPLLLIHGVGVSSDCVVAQHR